MSKTAAPSIDILITHLDAVVGHAAPEIVPLYVGFFAVTAVATLEDSLKSTLVACAEAVDERFGTYVENNIKRLNAQVKIDQITGHLSLFGDEPKNSFKRQIESFMNHSQGLCKTDLTSRYSNLVSARHAFAHGSQITLTYDEAKLGYKVGKAIIGFAKNSLTRTLSP